MQPLQRHHLLLILLLPALAAFIACGGSKDEPGKTTIRYARWGLPEEMEAEKELLKKFEAANPGIKVVVEATSWGEYWNKLQAQMAANQAPDVFLMNGSYAHDYVSRGQLENLQPLVAGDTSIKLGDYFESPIKVFQFSDGLWGMPRDCNTVGIYYNKTLFDKYGVPYPQPGWTWDDFLDKARKLTVDENKDGRVESYGFLASFDSMEVHWVSWVWQNNGEVVDPTGKTCLINSPEAIGAMEFYSGLVSKEKVSPDTAAASTFGSNMFLTGRLAMSSEGSWMLRAFADIDHFQWDVAPLPKGKRDVAVVNGLGIAIYAKSKQKEAAWKLVKFLSSKEYQEPLATSGTSIPALKSIAYSPTYLDGKPAGKKYFLQQIETGRAQDFGPGFARWDDAIRSELELVWLGRKDVKTALNDAKKKVDDILAANGKPQ